MGYVTSLSSAGLPEAERALVHIYNEKIIYLNDF
jgi:hypothetical protein